MSDNSFNFLSFLIKKEYLKKINAPLPGCMVIKFEGDKIVDSGILKKSQSFEPADQYQFFESIPVVELKQYFVEYVTTEPLVLPFRLKSY